MNWISNRRRGTDFNKIISEDKFLKGISDYENNMICKYPSTLLIILICLEWNMQV